MLPHKVLRTRHWTEEEKKAVGFRYYHRKKMLLMVRELPASEAPMMIQTGYETLVAPAGYIICYSPGTVLYKNREDYPHWPLLPEVFAKTYRAWDEPDWTPSPTESHLSVEGCKPYYKFAGTWAKKTDCANVGTKYGKPQTCPCSSGSVALFRGDG